MLREKFIVLKACIVKKGKSQVNNLSFHLKKIEKESSHGYYNCMVTDGNYQGHYFVTYRNLESLIYLELIYCCRSIRLEGKKEGIGEAGREQ